jgi:hypothetical protein
MAKKRVRKLQKKSQRSTDGAQKQAKRKVYLEKGMENVFSL